MSAAQTIESRVRDGGADLPPPLSPPLIRRTLHRSHIAAAAATTARIRIGNGHWLIEVTAVSSGENPTIAVQFDTPPIASRRSAEDPPAAGVDYGTLVATLGFSVSADGHAELTVWETRAVTAEDRELIVTATPPDGLAA